MTRLFGNDAGVHQLNVPLFNYHSHWIKNEKNEDVIWENYFYVAFVFDEIRSIHVFKKFILIVYEEHNKWFHPEKFYIKYCYQWFHHIKQEDRFFSDGNKPNQGNHHINDWVLDMLERGLDSVEEILNEIQRKEDEITEIQHWIDKLKRYRLFAEKTQLFIPNEVSVGEFNINMDVDMT